MKVLKREKFDLIKPASGMWLYNESDGTITNSLIAPRSLDLTGWTEITESEKESIEQLLNTPEIVPEEIEIPDEIYPI